MKSERNQARWKPVLQDFWSFLTPPGSLECIMNIAMFQLILKYDYQTVAPNSQRFLSSMLSMTSTCRDINMYQRQRTWGYRQPVENRSDKHCKRNELQLMGLNDRCMRSQNRIAGGANTLSKNMQRNIRNPTISSPYMFSYYRRGECNALCNMFTILLTPRPVQLVVCTVWYGESGVAVHNGQILRQHQQMKDSKIKEQILTHPQYVMPSQGFTWPEK